MKEAITFLNNLLKENDTIVLGISGGPDSMCLLHVINSFKDKLNLTLVCAHVNHNLRKESENEKKFVQDYCVKNNIIFEYMIIDKYKKNKFSEKEGREKRYQFFDELIYKYNAKYLMTAHHGDDLIETILMRIVRGSNLKGYVGIPQIINKEKYKIVRPLINVDKEEIYKYLDKENVFYVIDKSNDDLKYTRNRFRKHMLPFLKAEDKLVHLKFLKFSRELENYNNYINKMISKKIDKIYVDKKIIISELIKEDKFLQEKIIEYIIENIQKQEIFNINDSQFESILNLINNKGNKQIDLADGFIARKSYNYLIIEKNINNSDYKYELKDELILFDTYKFERLKESKDKSNYIIRLDSKEISLPLYVRNKKNGDKIKIKNLAGTKKVKDIFIDYKLDLKKRESYPIVVDSKDNIIWIPGIKKSIFDKDIQEKCDIIIKCTEEKK